MWCSKEATNEALADIEQGSANYSPGDKSRALPAFITTVLLEHGHVCSFMDLCLSKSLAAFNGRVE